MNAHPSLLERLLIFYARYFPVSRGKAQIINRLWKSAAGADTGRMARLKPGKFLMPCDISKLMQRQFYFFGTYFYEEELLESWMALARPAATILDVGANAGIYSLAAIAANPGAAVHAFEPTPDIADRLRQTVRLNGLKNLEVHQAALSSTAGQSQLVFYDGNDGSNDGMNFLSGHAGAEPQITVETVTIDGFCAARGIARIDLLKMDVQGHEFEVLLGASGMLARQAIGTVFLELNWSQTADCPAAKSVDLLEQCDYIFQDPVRPAEPRPAGPWLRRLDNAVALANRARKPAAVPG